MSMTRKATTRPGTPQKRKAARQPNALEREEGREGGRRGERVRKKGRAGGREGGREGGKEPRQR